MSKRNTLERLPDNKRSIDQNRFTWTATDGTHIDIPTLGGQSPKRLREYHSSVNSKDVDTNLYGISALADNAAMRERIDNLPLNEITRLLKAWQRQGSKELAGKSGPSSV